jgi:hypothetical protein
VHLGLDKKMTLFTRSSKFGWDGGAASSSRCSGSPLFLLKSSVEFICGWMKELALLIAPSPASMHPRVENYLGPLKLLTDI